MWRGYVVAVSFVTFVLFSSSILEYFLCSIFCPLEPVNQANPTKTFSDGIPGTPTF